MPYKDPKKQAEANRKASARYRKKNIEKEKLRSHQRFQKKHDRRLEVMRNRNRERGHKPRVVGPKAHPKVTVSDEEGARIYEFNNKAYIKFTTTRGLNWDEIKKWTLQFAQDNAILQQAPATPKRGRRKWGFLKSRQGQPRVLVSHRNGLSLDDVQLLVSEFKGYSSIADPSRSTAPTVRVRKLAASPPAELDDRFVKEGGRKLKFGAHYWIERKPQNASAKKQFVLKSGGTLACEVCGFDFFRAYGPIGQDFCEVHHLIPLASLTNKRAFQASELAIFCANCHRMLHRKQGCLTLDELRSKVRHKITYSE